MKMTVCTVALAVGLSLCGCTAPEKTQMNELGKDSTNSLKTLGKDVGSVGQSIKSSTEDLGKDSKKGSNQSNDLQKDASNAIGAVGKEGDKAEHAMAHAIKGIGKNIDAMDKGEKDANSRPNRVTKLDHSK
jgi:flagellar hook-basal body complex protein FliE